MYTKNALGNLKNRYMAVLKKCALINIFGSLALATMFAMPHVSLASALITDTKPELNNTTTLNGGLEGLSGGNYFVGMFGYNSGNINYIFTNKTGGIINLSSSSNAYGMLADATGSHQLTNEANAQITVTSTNAEAYGMSARGNGNHTLTNNGTISAIANGAFGSSYAYGMYVYVSGNHTLTNNGIISISSANSFGYGMYVQDVGDSKLINGKSGKITLNGHDVYGMYISSGGNKELQNKGTITIENVTSLAYGMSANSDGDYTLTNDGTINNTVATESSLYGMSHRSAYESNTVKFINNGEITLDAGMVYGMSASTSSSNYQLTNSKDASINVTGTREVHGMYAFSGGTHELANEGKIVAKSTGNYTSAYGMYANGDGNHTMINYQNAEITVNAKYNAYGMYTSGDGINELGNGGIIKVTSDSRQAYGMYAFGDNSHKLSNSGTVEATSTSDHAYGMDAHGEGNHVLENSGTVTVKNTNKIAYGMYAYGTGDHTLTNFANGSIFATSTIERAYGMSAGGEGDHKLTNSASVEAKSTKGEAFAMYVSALGDHTVKNNINSSLSATSTEMVAYGMYVSGNGNGHTLENVGIIKTTSTENKAYGMYAEGEAGHTLTNFANAKIESTSTDGDTYGMYADAEFGTGNHNLNNSGTIVSTSSKNNAYAMYAAGKGNHKLSNSGTIEATSSNSGAYAMHADGAGNHNLSNSGTIEATSSDYAIGMRVAGNGKHILTNEKGATITATSLGSNGEAYAMVISNAGANSDGHIVNNLGTINVSSSGGNAYEVFGRESYNVGTYALTLRGYAANNTVFGVDEGKVVNFENSTLILRPDATNFEDGKEYDVASMVAVYNSSSSSALPELAKNLDGTVAKGVISQVQTEVPHLEANLIDGNTENPKVSLSAKVTSNTVSPITLPNAAVTRFHSILAKIGKKTINTKLQRRMLQNNIAANSQELYKQGVIVAGNAPYAPSYNEDKWQLYLDAFAGYTGNSDFNTGTHEKGMTLGAERLISDKLSVGFAMGFTDSVTDGANGLLTDSTALTVATNADYYINDNWYVGGKMAFSTSENDMDYMISPTLYAKDDYKSHAFYLALNTGYIYEINQNNVIIPEVGLSYLYSKANDINVDFLADDTYDMFIKNDSFSALYASLMVTWQGQYDLARGTLTPTAGIGIRQNLTGADFDSSVQTLGTSFDAVVSEDDTTFLANVGIEWKNGAFSVGVSYDGEYGSNQKSHSGNVRFKLEF